MSDKAKSLVSGGLQRIVALVMFVGVPIAAASFVYLAYVYLGPGKGIANMPQDAASNFMRGIWIAEQAFTISAIAVCVAVVLDNFNEQTTGLLLLVVGAILYLGMPYVFVFLAESRPGTAYPVGDSIIRAIGVPGLVAAVPGVFMLIRDTVLMIVLRSRTSHREVKTTQEKERREKQGTSIRPLPKCWDIAFCSEYVKKACPAWKTRRPCWRLRTGCYCEEYAILKMIPGSREFQEAAEMAKMTADGVRKAAKQPVLQLSNRQKKERCQKCQMYIEHQRQKFRVMGVLVFPIVATILYFSYTLVGKLSYVALANSDRFFALFSPGSKAGGDLTADVHIVTIVSMVVLGIILLIATLRLAEYLVFDLQI